MKRTQELENKASALKREVEILRASARQHKEKMQQLHELLASREEMHRYTSTTWNHVHDVFIQRVTA